MATEAAPRPEGLLGIADLDAPIYPIEKRRHLPTDPDGWRLHLSAPRRFADPLEDRTSGVDTNGLVGTVESGIPPGTPRPPLDDPVFAGARRLHVLIIVRPRASGKSGGSHAVQRPSLGSHCPTAAPTSSESTKGQTTARASVRLGAISRSDRPTSAA